MVLLGLLLTAVQCYFPEQEDSQNLVCVLIVYTSSFSGTQFSYRAHFKYVAKHFPLSEYADCCTAQLAHAAYLREFKR